MADLSALADWIDVSTRPALVLPRRLVLIGRTSVGKTTLFNALASQSAPTGLGGVTREVQEARIGSHLIVDTPGIDSRDRALRELGPEIDRSHGVIWVVDGLQPVTRTERDVLELLLPQGHPLDIRIARADLLGQEAGSVRDRVIAHTAVFEPRSVVLVDLRATGRHPELLQLTPTPSERAVDRTWLQAQLPLLDAVRPLRAEDVASRTDLRRQVRELLESLTQSGGPAEWIADLSPALQALADDAVIRWNSDPLLAPVIRSLPRLPTPPDPSTSPLGVLRLTAAGPVGTIRELKRWAGSWAAEVEVLLSDWRDGLTFDEEAEARWQTQRQALSAELGQL